MDQLKDLLQRANYRVTTPRETVFRCLLRAERAVSIAEITARCHDIDRVSVYRTLELFENLQIATRVPRGWKHAYELAEPFKPHHHHFSCNDCGRVISLESSAIEGIIHDIARTHHVSVSSHTFEIHGLCSDCRLLEK